MFRLGKKLMIYFFAAVILLTSAVTVAAEEEIVVNYGVEAEVVDPGVAGWPNPPSVTAETAVVMEMTTAICQYNKGRNEYRTAGALTKFMVMLLAAENCDLEAEIKFSKEVVAAVADGEMASIGAKSGEVMTVKDCLYAISINSANDAILQLAEYIGGTTEEFLAMMNARAKELGCNETTFVSVTGLDGDNYTSAYDTALIARAGLRNENLRTIVKKTSYTIAETNKSKKRKLVCENPLINVEDAGYYEGCREVAIFEDEGGYNMIAAAKRNDITYIVVTFGNKKEDDSYVDSRALLDYAHNNFEKSDFMIGSVVFPKTVSTDVIRVNGSSDKVEVTQRYYVNGWLVGRGSQNIEPPTTEETTSLLADLLPTPTDEAVSEEETVTSEEENVTSEEETEISGEETVTSEEKTEISEEEEDSDEIIDMIEAKEELEYFTVFGLTLREWNRIGVCVIVVALVFYFIVFSIVRMVQRSKRKQREERERRRLQYDDED